MFRPDTLNPRGAGRATENMAKHWQEIKFS